MTSRNIFALCICAISFVGIAGTDAAVAPKKQSAIQTGTTVRARVNATGVYDQDCYDAYYGCMDQFCIMDNTNGGSCACSDQNEKLEQELAEIQEILNNAERIRTEDVERVRAGANADIIFNGTRQYDENGNVIYSKTNEQAKEERRANLLSLWDEASFDFDEEVFESSMETIADKTGDALFVAADELCRAQISNSCSKDLKFLQQMYARQITSDCKAFENSITQNRSRANSELAAANADVRAALQESFAESNKYDLGQCMVEFKKCMQNEDACGTDWINCVSTIASENMQNNVTTSTAKTKVKVIDVYDITASTMETLNSKRTICEHVLDKCVAVRDQVWPAFLREAAPTIRLAESNAESKFRQSCLTNISDCIQTACRDDIAGKGVATMDSCLSRPDMARSFCKVEIDPCERMEPLIWGYVTDKLAAMRIDACTTEVKECITDETRCGADFSKCIGMDFSYIHDICPLDKLVVCKANNPNFAMSDLDSMLMGLYLNIDNSALDVCQNLVDSKMLEVCGSTTDCDKFAADDTIGTGSLRSVKDGNKYRVTGMISFGSIKIGESGKRNVGKINVEEYIESVKKHYEDSGDKIANADEIIFTIEEELNNIAGTVNRTIDMIEQDPEIQFCVSGRNLEQITGRNGKTTARYPHLLDQIKMQISTSALRRAQDNYNKKFNAAVADATKNASADVAQYLCQMMPVAGGAVPGAVSVEDTSLTPPYSISYEISSGLDNSMLAQGGHGVSATGTDGVVTSGAEQRSTGTQIVSAVLSGGASLGIDAMSGIGNKHTVTLPSGTREMWSTFNRDARVCHFCTSTVTKSCSSVYKRGFLGIGAKDESDCKETAPVEKCEDIPM